MKKKAMFMFLLTVFAYPLIFAQVQIGIRVGAGLGNVSTPTIIDLVAPDFHYLPGLDIGVLSEFTLTENFALQSELNFREKGFRMHENMDVNLFNLDIPLGVRVDTRIRYLDMPILLKYKFGAGSVRGYLAAGPEVGYALNGRIKTKANFLIDWNLTNTNINLDGIGYERWSVGGVAGAGVEFATGNGTFFADVRYQQGFTDSFQLPVVELDIRNHGFGFGVGYKIAL